MSVLVYGLRGIGVETVKNLALQGVGSITLVDSKIAEAKDMGVNFFIYESDINLKKTRAEIVTPRMQELNPLCTMKSAISLTDELILEHSAVVITQPMPLYELCRLNELCRKNQKSFFYSFTCGISTTIFVDLGNNHVVTDFNGEKPIQKLITEITSIGDEECLVRYDHPAGQQPTTLSDGMYEFSEVIGFDDINGKSFNCIHKHSDPVKTIRIPYDMIKHQNYISGGLIVEKKIPTAYPMHSLEMKIKDPGSTFAEPPSLVQTDLIHFGSELQQHVAFISTLTFFTEKGYLPRINSEDSLLVLHIAKRLLTSKEIYIQDFEIDDIFICRYASHAAAELQPMSAFTGGILAQEVVKCTGKFTPIPGFFHFSAPEALPDNAPAHGSTVAKGRRNDELAAIYGWPFVEKLSNLNYFMVGSGALGCEFFKNFALNSICAGPSGKLVVTDADRIELSNLTRQFLFREHNVGQPKSKAAAAMAKLMNSQFNANSLEMYVGPKTEDTFNDEFWLGLDGVCNALDNMEARLYVDKMCVKYEKTLLESGTMGTNGNVDTICPFKTRTYKDGGNAAEGGNIPMCTLRNFPQITDHCIEWARDQFELLFVKLGKTCESYISDPKAFENDILGKSDSGQAIFETRLVTAMFKAIANPSISGAAQLALDVFHFFFRDKILDLQAACPKDMRIIDKLSGQDKGPFWGEKKRYPTAAAYNHDDESHTSFLLSTTCLFAIAIGIVPQKNDNDDNWLREYRSYDFMNSLATKLSVCSYVQAPVVSEEINMSVSALSKDGILAQLFKELHVVTDNIRLPRLVLADFEKDDDLNFHVAFVTAAANLRCDNYAIKRTNFQSTKVIAGKIIAAIATTTAAVCGLVMLELFKLQLEKPTDAYMNRQIGLGSNTFTSFTQEPPIKYKTYTENVIPDYLPDNAYDEKGHVKNEFISKIIKRAYPEDHSTWDKLVCIGSLTLREFANWLANEHKLKLISWDFIYGYKNVVDEEKKKTNAGVSAPLYPPKIVLNPSLLPPIDLTLAQATQMILKNPTVKPAQQYIALWKECKSTGIIPEVQIDKDAINLDMTIASILLRMENLGLASEATGIIDEREISSLASRKFWVIPSSSLPVCSDLETNEEIEHMASIKILLDQ